MHLYAKFDPNIPCCSRFYEHFHELTTDGRTHIVHTKESCNLMAAELSLVLVKFSNVWIRRIITSKCLTFKPQYVISNNGVDSDEPVQPPVKLRNS